MVNIKHLSRTEVPHAKTCVGIRAGASAGSHFKATLALIAQMGLRKVTVDDIAAAVGIGKGSFYAYYSLGKC